jgi:Ca-activated chloride channel family protein
VTWGRFLFLFLTFLFLLQLSVNSQTVNNGKQEQVSLTRILFVFDASQSMYGRWQSDQKFNIARLILSKVLDSLSTMENVEVGLRVYGHQYTYPPGVCTDSRLEVPFARDNFERIKNKLSSITPKGTSPIAYSLELTGKDFPPCDNCRNIVVLITDGIEECGGDPCAASQKLQKEGIIMKPFIVGIGRSFADAFNCVGTYFDAANEEQLGKVLSVVISRVMNPTTAQVNLMDAYGKPTETNVNMTFYNSLTGKIEYNFIHTMNSMGLPDTLHIDPLITYNIVVNTIPPVLADSVHLNSGIHNIIPISVPQGFLSLKLASQSSIFKDLKCIIRRKGSMETINLQTFGEIEKYINGSYSLEVLSLPRMFVDEVKISQNLTTIVEIPTPGIAVIQKSTRGYGSLYVEKDGKLEWIYNFRDTQQTQESLVLLPGTYKAIFRSRYSDRSFYTIEKSFIVQSGLTTNVKLID